MHLKMRSGIAGKGIALETCDIVDWQDEAEAKRMIEKYLADPASKEEIRDAGEKVKTYTPPKPNPEDRWPRRQLKELERDYGEEAKEARLRR